MRTPLFFLALISAIHFLTSCCCWAVEKDVWEQVSHNVRLLRHEDGTRTEYRRSNDEKTLVKRRLSDVKGGRDSIISTTIYRMDASGNPLSCKIYDGKENLLYKVAYGYHKKTGRLLAEDMFDARAPKRGPDGKEIPVRRMYWFYDANGNVSKAFSFVFRKGKYAEEMYDKSKSSFPENPFKN
ncbi:MAG: hypothetical protein AAGC74_14565 [Verrucomicrobiota bacterium]